MTGCLLGCSYCYGPRLSKRWGLDFSKPEFHPKRLEEPAKIKQPSKIFVCSFGELFGNWIPNDWIEQVLEMVRQCPQHTFQFLSKNPRRYRSFRFPANCWLGTTITGDDDKDEARIEELSLSDWSGVSHVRFISAEPLMGNVARLLYPGSWVKWEDYWLGWVIIGALTQARSAEQGRVKREYVDDLITYCDQYHVPVFVKDNVGLAFPRREWPKTEIEPLEYSTNTSATVGGG